MRVIPIKDPGPSVENVLKDVMKQSPTFRSVAVVAVDKRGELILWASGRCEDICASALSLDEFAKAHIRGDVEHEFPPAPIDPGP